MTITRRQAEKALRDMGCSRSFAKQICDNGLPGYMESLSEEEKIELGLIELRSGDRVMSLLRRADELLN